MNFGNALRTNALVSAIAVGLCGFATMAEADTLQDMKVQIEALQKKVLELEQKQRTAEQKEPVAGSNNAVTGGATKGSFKLPGSNTSITMGGYAKLHAVFSSPSAGVDNKAVLLSTMGRISLHETEDGLDGHLQASAKYAF